MTAQETLIKYWGYNSFRKPQEEIINAVLSKKNVLALLPTGGGKSVCFQVPAMMTEGICLVITPLIALMKDQVEQLTKRGIKAAFIDSSLHKKEVEIIIENCISGRYKFLYISPERINTTLFINAVNHMHINLVAVDEAHCISQWGYDFRPSYLQIHKLWEVLSQEVTCIALTASATLKVRDDIIDKLQLKDVKIFSKSFSRSNLSYSCFNLDNKQEKLFEILNKVPGSSIVYVKTRAQTKEIAATLLKMKNSTEYYHGGLNHKERSLKQENWVKGNKRIMVATNAFGMGIDKPDVRTVIHYQLPDSLEAYYQEAGRAGRDGKKSFAVAIFNQFDLDELVKNLEEKYPEVDYIKHVYQCLANFFQVVTGTVEETFNFSISDFQKKFNLDPRKTFYALEHLQQQNIILFNETYYSPSKLFIPNHSLLYEFQVANAAYDEFIKTILRTYGGKLYTDFIKISEVVLAKKMNTTEDKITNALLALNNIGVAIYQPVKDKPQITFLNERYDLKTLPFNVTLYRTRKSDAIEKLNAALNFYTNSKRCRTQLICEYFNEIYDDECGICDNCIKNRKRLTINQQENEKIKSLILKNTSFPIRPEELLKLMDTTNKDTFYGIIKDLLDHNILSYNNEGKISININYK